MNPVIIGIAGKLRSGKSTLAGTLAYNHNMKVLSFAKFVREEVAHAFYPNSEDPVAEWMALEAGNKAAIRPILQAWGHGKRVLLSDDYWVDALDRQVRKESVPVVFVDDVRYPNEAEYIINNGGYIVRLLCDTDTLLTRGASEKALAHPSENSLDLENLTLAESMRPTHTMTTDSGILNERELQRLVTQWCMQNNIPLSEG